MSQHKDRLKDRTALGFLCGGWAGGARVKEWVGAHCQSPGVLWRQPDTGGSPLRGQGLQENKGLASLQIPHRTERVPGKQMLIE